MKLNWRTLLLLLCTCYISSCTKESIEPIGYRKGVFMPSEGWGGHYAAGLSFLNSETGTLENNLFETHLGFTTYELECFQGKAYLLADGRPNDENFLVFSLSDMTLVGSIDSILYPVSVAFVNTSKGYLCHSWSLEISPDSINSGSAISIFNPQTLAVVDTLVKDLLFRDMLVVSSDMVLASGDSHLYKINSVTDQIVDSVLVESSPSELVLDMNGNVWTITLGSQSEPVRLVKVNPNSMAIEFNQMIPGSLSHQGYQFPNSFFTFSWFRNSLIIDDSGQNLYWIYDTDVYGMNISDNQLPTIPFKVGDFLRVGLDDLNQIYYTSNGGSHDGSGAIVKRFDSSWNLIDSMEVGLGPVEFSFTQ